MSRDERSILPQHLEKRTDGEPRHVGFEIEFGGLTFETCLDVLERSIGSEVESTSPVEAKITHPEFGDFNLELDWQFLKQQAKSEAFEDDLVRTVAAIAGMVVPLELVFPPIDVTRLDAVKDIVDSLAGLGASGTDESPFYAFGVHINTEIPELSPECLARYLKAYCLLQEHLVLVHSVDPSRRISPYVDLFGKEYIATVLAYENPTMDTIVTDYLKWNPTRNRALDMLPMLSMADEDKVKSIVPDDRIKARPAFHYRLPNCDIGNPEWTILTEWNRWCLVELLADKQDLLDALGAEYTTRLKADQFATDANWAEYIGGFVRTRLGND